MVIICVFLQNCHFISERPGGRVEAGAEGQTNEHGAIREHLGTCRRQGLVQAEDVGPVIARR
eukprot:16204174-Heterocapsa_arctica.AAC.1